MILAIAGSASEVQASGGPEWLQGAIGALVTVAVAWIGYKGVKRKSEANHQQVLYDSLSRRLEVLEEKVASLEQENLHLEAENSRLSAENRSSRDIIAGFMRWLDLFEAWENHNYEGSRPVYPWSIRVIRDGEPLGPTGLS
ncbi:hypothetical protein Q7C18_02720 [Nesterenkonia sp. CL21]|uniref:hypothetical protein n=1 Tax=Nesterenkonia sp. CL21 TaxID=3064894 RepID=UPI002878593A|nr:hypothetical protein [Nesterenkonia sp. CL21]MDS2171602.1 hypothetical protein [Nesterenkonia sp. CL21]